MLPRKTFRLKSPRMVIVATAAVCALAGGQAVASTATGSDGQTTAAAVVSYDASGSEEFADAVEQGAGIWNDSVENVQFEPVESGEEADVTVLADDGWPRAEVPSLGKGTVYMGRQAMDEGYDEVRVAAHELGHTLGLPDMKPGPCSSLMSGASAGPECTNPNPDEDEKSEVESNFGEQYAQLRQQRLDRVFVDRP